MVVVLVADAGDASLLPTGYDILHEATAGDDDDDSGTLLQEALDCLVEPAAAANSVSTIAAPRAGPVFHAAGTTHACGLRV